MKSKLSKRGWFGICICLLLAAGFIFAATAPTLFSGLKDKYSDLEENEMTEKLMELSFSEICDEINVLSENGVDLSDLLFHSVAVVEKANTISPEDFLRVVEDRRNSTNLRVICIQALDFLGDTISLQENSSLQAILANETEDSLVRQNIVWALPSSEASSAVLESIVFEDDELLAFQALKRLNMDAPDRARAVADTLLASGAQREKLRIAIKVITAQLAQSEDPSEKDQWVAYCMHVFESSPSDSKTDLMRDTIIFALSDLRYANALYEIINSSEVDDSLKSFCVEQNCKVLFDVLEGDPSPYDIEMAIKAMTIYPVDKTVDALKAAVEKSGEAYNLDAVLSQEANPALERRFAE